MNCQDATAARGVSNKMNYFSYALSYFETFKEKINSKRYASIERINSDIEDIKISWIIVQSKADGGGSAAPAPPDILSDRRL